MIPKQRETLPINIGKLSKKLEKKSLTLEEQKMILEELANRPWHWYYSQRPSEPINFEMLYLKDYSKLECSRTLIIETGDGKTITFEVTNMTITKK